MLVCIMKRPVGAEPWILLVLYLVSREVTAVLWRVSFGGCCVVALLSAMRFYSIFFSRVYFCLRICGRVLILVALQRAALRCQQVSRPHTVSGMSDWAIHQWIDYLVVPWAPRVLQQVLRDLIPIDWLTDWWNHLRSLADRTAAADALERDKLSVATFT